MSQQLQIVLRLREMIAAGELRPGERVAEVRIAELLGVSRTPVRYALGVLCREGLVVPTANQRGYVVRDVTPKDMHDATQLRGVLEGMAARLVAEAGLPDGLLGVLNECVADGAALIEKGALAPDDGGIWAEINERFHSAIIEACANQPLIQALRINDQVPFSSARSFLNDPRNLGATRRQYALLATAQRQHETILRCLKTGESARVEALMREHCLIAMENIALFRPEPGGVLLTY